MKDFVTVVSPARDGVLTKRISRKADGEYRIKAQAHHLQYKSQVEHVAGIRELSDLLIRLEKSPRHAVIRGRLNGVVDPDCHQRRKAEKHKDGTGAYETVTHQYVMIDMDGVPAEVFQSTPAGNPEGVVREAIALLPPLFQDVTCHWQFSSSQGFKRSKDISLHLWFWLDIEADDQVLRSYFNVINEGLKTEHGFIGNVIDSAVCDAIQLHFTAAPILVDINDTLPRRSGLLEGAVDAVPISQEWRFNAEPGKFVHFLEQIGDDKDGFHNPILSGIASWISEFGKPDKRSRTELKNLVRGTIDAAERAGARTEDEINRYKSDRYLDALIDSAIAKGFGDNAPNQAAIEDVKRSFVYVATTDCFLHTTKHIEMRMQGMNLAHMNVTGGKAIVPLLMIDSEFRQVDASQNVPGDTNEITTVGPLTVLNTWHGRPVEPQDGDVDFMLEHLRFLTDDDQEGFDHLCWYLAHVMARPGVKIRHGLVLGSRFTGTGKSYLRFLVESVIGRPNVGVITNETLKEHYTDWAVGSEVLFIEELMTHGRLEIANKLKPLITEDDITVRRMYSRSYTTRNFSNYICFTNHENALVLHEQDRRYWVWFSEAEPKDGDYYRALFKRTAEQAGAIYRWALDYDLDRFDPGSPAPETASKLMMEEATEDHVTATLRAALDARAWPLKCDLVVVADLMVDAQRVLGKASSHRLGKALRHLGAVKIGQKRLADGTRPMVWAVRDGEKWLRANEADIAETYHRAGRHDEVQGVDF